LVIVLIIVGAVVLFAVGIYNGLITLRNRANNAWAQVDVQLRRRYDLIPNLVETVKGYAKHERETFQMVTEARANVMNAQTVKEQDALWTVSQTLNFLKAGLITTERARTELQEHRFSQERISVYLQSVSIQKQT